MTAVVAARHSLIIMQGVHVQGLQASVTILDAELVSIERQQQYITLSDQTRVRYGLLVLTVGLQPSCSLAAHQLSSDSQQVCSLQDLQHRIPKVSQAKVCAAQGPTNSLCCISCRTYPEQTYQGDATLLPMCITSVSFWTCLCV